MSNTRNTGFLTNVVKYTDKGDISFVSGSTTLMSISSSGAVTVTGVISGSNALSSSYAVNADQLDNLDSTSFVFTSSFNTYSSSMSTRVTNNESTGSTLTTASASFAVVSSSYSSASGSLSTRVTKIEGNYATTGSNVFLGAQTVCANITSTGTIIAQTLNVQQVTSSVVYSSGSNVFGCSLTNTQQFTGSVTMTGSLTVTTAGTSPEFQVAVGGNTIGNALTDVHQVTGSLRITGSVIGIGNACITSVCSPAIVGGTVSGTTIYGSTAICGGVICGGATTLTGALSGTSATFSSTLTATQLAINTTVSDMVNIVNVDNSGRQGIRLNNGINNSGGIVVFNSTSSTGTETGGLIRGHQQSTSLAQPTAVFRQDGSADIMQLQGSAGAVRFSVASTGAATFSGNVGLNVTLSSWDTAQVRVLELGTVGNYFAGYVGSSTIYLGNNSYLDSVGWKYARTAAPSQIDMGGGAFRFNNAASGTAGNALTWSTRMFISSDGNVGIGTTSPTSNYGFEKNLTIASANNAELSLSQTGNSNFFSIGITNGFNFFQTTTGQGYVFYIAGTERMRITSGGLVAINTTSVNQQFTVAGSYTRTEIRATDNSNAGSFFKVLNGASTVGQSSQYVDNGGNYIITTGTTSESERMRITSDGAIGIGCATPSYRLDILDTCATGVRGLRINTASSSVGPSIILRYCPGGITNWLIGTSQAVSHALEFVASNSLGGDPGSAGTTRLLITCGGKVGIMTTDPKADLHVCGSTATLRVGPWFSTNDRDFIQLEASGTDTRILSPNERFKIENTDGCVQIVAGGSGGVQLTPGATSWASMSDRRKKKNFEPTQGLATLLQIEPVKYHFQWDNDCMPKRMGFIAQNIQPLIPEMVSKTDEKAEDGSDYLTITPDYILPVLVKSIQEQQCTICMQSTIIDQLRICLGLT